MPDDEDREVHDRRNRSNGGGAMTDEADDRAPADDERLLRELGSAMGSESLPDGLVDRVDGLLAWADVDHELAALLDASAAEPAGRRGASAAPGDELSFELADGDVTVEVAIVGRELAVDVIGADATEVAAELAGGERLPATVDLAGRFVVAGAHGPVRLLLRIDGSSVRTDWFTV
jgi:hypothetical protein